MSARPDGATWVIVNPAAGTSAKDPDIETRLRGALGTHCRTVDSPGEARLLAREAAEAGAALVVAAGGDGTVRDVARGIVDAGGDGGEGSALGIVPLGTGNDLARSLEIPDDWRAAAELLRGGGTVRRLDVLRLLIDGETDLATNSVVVGNGARPGADLDPSEKARWGPLSYLRKAVDVALELDALEVELSVDGSTPRVLEVLNVMIANGSTAGGGVPIGVGGSPFDGVMEVTVIAGLELPALVRLIPPLLEGEEPEHEGHHQFRVREAVVRSATGEPLPLSVDGETASAREVSATLDAGRLPVLVPGPQTR